MLSGAHSVPTSSAVAIIGAGPIGLEAAAWAASRHWDVAVFEKGSPGEHIRHWGHIRLFSAFGLNHSDWGPHLLEKAFPDLTLPRASSYITGQEYVERYLEPLSRLPCLSERVFTGTEVIQIGKEKLGKSDWIGDNKRTGHPFRLLLRSEDGEIIHRSKTVIDSSGVYSCPQFLGDGNIPAPGELEAKKKASTRLHYGLVDIQGQHLQQFEGRRTLLVGGGYSAATALEAFQQLAVSAPGTRVFWINRSSEPEPYHRFENDPLPYRDDLGRLGNQLALSPPEWLHYFSSSGVEEIVQWPVDGQGTFEVVISTADERVTVQVDEIIASVGFAPDHSLYRQLQVHECYATSGPIKLAAALLGGSADCLAQEAQGIDTLKNPEPHFFILGNKSYGTNPTFLISHGIAQVKTVMEYLEKVTPPTTQETL